MTLRLKALCRLRSIESPESESPTRPCPANTDSALMPRTTWLNASTKVYDLVKGEVYIEPPYTDEFAVDIADIASIETEEAFEVELDDDLFTQFSLRSGD